MHALLRRQLRKLGLNEDSAPTSAQWLRFLERVTCTYTEADQDRYTLERSLMTSSRELQEIFDESRRSAETNFRILVERSPDAVFIHHGPVIRYANPAMASLLGYDDPKQLIGVSTFDSFVHRADGVRTTRPPARSNSGAAPDSRQVRWLRRDGSAVLVQGLSIAIMFDNAPATLSIARDVTDTRRLEEELRQAQKMEAIGRLAGGIAHDFNNILAAILAYAEFATSGLGDDHPVTADVQEIAAAARRAVALTQQLLTFSRKQPWRPTSVALNSVVTGMEKMLSRIISEDIQVSSTLAVRLASVRADPSQLEQLILNLAVNARDAMPAGGRLTLSTENVILEGSQAADAGVPPGAYVMLAVSDTGCGIDAETRTHIYEPFFTTKEMGKGTGLGLSTVFGIVKVSGGGISVDSEVGTGTTFRIYFPATTTKTDSTAPASERPPEQGSETVLVVEDDEQVRNVVLRVLTTLGYNVIVAPSGRAALETLAVADGSVNLVLTDMIMPDMDGRTMAGRVLERYPGMRVLYMSGYAQHPSANGLVLGPGDHFLQKPFTAQEMAMAVRRALDQGAASSAASPTS